MKLLERVKPRNGARERWGLPSRGLFYYLHFVQQRQWVLAGGLSKCVQHSTNTHAHTVKYEYPEAVVIIAWGWCWGFRGNRVWD